MKNISDSNKAHAILKDLGATNRAFFIGPFVLLYLGRSKKPDVKLELHVQVDGLHLAYIENLKKRGGHGKKAMSLLCKLADLNHRCPIHLDLDPTFGRTAKQLREFYSLFDFQFKGRHGVRK